jgi:hypothetical protein
VYDHDPSEVDDLGWEEFVSRQWDAIFIAYRAGRGRRALCRGWADLLEAGLGCSQSVADQLVRAEVLDRADRDLEGTSNPRALVAGMTQLLVDVRGDLAERIAEDRRVPPGLLDRHEALLDFLRDYAFVAES